MDFKSLGEWEWYDRLTFIVLIIPLVILTVSSISCGV